MTVFKRRYGRQLSTLGERLSLIAVGMSLEIAKREKTITRIPLGVVLFCTFFCLTIGCFFWDLDDKKIWNQNMIKMVKNEIFSDLKKLRRVFFKSLKIFVYILCVYDATIRLNTLRTIMLIIPSTVTRMFKSDELFRRFFYKKRLICFVVVLACIDLLKHFQISTILGYLSVSSAWILSYNIDISMNSVCFLFSSLYCIPVILSEIFSKSYQLTYSVFTFFFIVISTIIHVILKSVNMFDIIYMVRFCWLSAIGIVLFLNFLFLKELPSFIDISSILFMYYCKYNKGFNPVNSLVLSKGLSRLENSEKHFSQNNFMNIYILKIYLTLIIRNPDSRSIFCFFLLNLIFMFIQMGYGFLSNSLGLISDSVHMAFDCFALFVGLFASIMSKFPSSVAFPYGFSRIEVLSGFMNGLLLLLISISIIVEAISRLLKPEEIYAEKLLLVSVVGLIVNLIGVFLFKHGYHHHSSNHHEFDNSYLSEKDFQHNDYSCSYSVNGCVNNSHHNVNIHGVFLHIFADTLGSVGVIVSTLLMHHFGWAGFDSLASILIAVLIFVSAIPLIVSCTKSLLLIVPYNFECDIYNALNKVKMHSKILCLKRSRFWMDNEDRITGVIHVGVKIDQDLNMVRQDVEKILKETIKGLCNITVVTEKY